MVNACKGTLSRESRGPAPDGLRRQGNKILRDDIEYKIRQIMSVEHRYHSCHAMPTHPRSIAERHCLLQIS
jgi:hypothetical protein